MNLTFLSPGILWLTALAGIPFLLHRLSRWRPRVVPFSDTRWLREAIQQATFRSRLRQWLLLLIRTLLALVLVFLFSRPVAHLGATGGTAAPDEGLAIVLVLDSSYSMRAKEGMSSRFARAQEAIRKTLDCLEAKDRVALVDSTGSPQGVASNRVEVNPSALPSGKESVRSALSAAAPTYRSGSLLAGLASAYEWLAASSARRKAIVIYSDHAQHAWARPQASWSDRLPHYDPRVHIILVVAGKPLENASIEDVQIAGGRDSLREAAARLAFFGKSVSSKGISLTLARKTTGQNVVTLNPAEPAFATLSFAPQLQDTPVGGWVELEPDSLPEDDRYYVVVNPPQVHRVLLVEGSPDAAPIQTETFYAGKALATLPEIQTETLHWSDFSQADLSRFDVVLWANVPPVDEFAMQALGDFVRKGGGCWVGLGDHATSLPVRPASPRGAQAGLPTGQAGLLADLLPLQVLGEPPASGSGSPQRAKPDHPFFETLRWEGYEWARVQVDKIVPVVPVSNATVLLRTADGRPLLVEGEFGKGRVWVWTSTLNRAWTNFPVKPAYVPFLEQAVRYLSPRRLDIEATQVTVGAFVNTTAVEGAKPLEMSEPGLVKVHRMIGGQEMERWMAVNLDRSSSEGDLSLASQNLIQSRLPASPLFRSEAPQDPQEWLVYLRGKDVTRAFAAIALVLAGLEMVLARKLHRSIRRN